MRSKGSNLTVPRRYLWKVLKHRLVSLITFQQWGQTFALNKRHVYDEQLVYNNNIFLALRSNVSTGCILAYLPNSYFIKCFFLAKLSYSLTVIPQVTVMHTGIITFEEARNGGKKQIILENFWPLIDDIV